MRLERRRGELLGIDTESGVVVNVYRRPTVDDYGSLLSAINEVASRLGFRRRWLFGGDWIEEPR